MVNGISKAKEKFYLPKLRGYLVSKGRSFSEFTDYSASIDKSPSRRAWADGTHNEKGVTETMANKMSIRVSQVFEKWGEPFPDEIKSTAKIS